MTREELFELHKWACNKAFETMKKKNNDYAHKDDDPFANFRASLEFGVEPEIGLLLRDMDKSKRIETFVNNGELKVNDESEEDACLDKLNYAILCLGLLRERRGKPVLNAIITDKIIFCKNCNANLNLIANNYGYCKNCIEKGAITSSMIVGYTYSEKSGEDIFPPPVIKSER